jgi:hypothetical protein
MRNAACEKGVPYISFRDNLNENIIPGVICEHWNLFTSIFVPPKSKFHIIFLYRRCVFISRNHSTHWFNTSCDFDIENSDGRACSLTSKHLSLVIFTFGVISSLVALQSRVYKAKAPHCWQMGWVRGWLGGNPTPLYVRMYGGACADTAHAAAHSCSPNVGGEREREVSASSFSTDRARSRNVYIHLRAEKRSQFCNHAVKKRSAYHWMVQNSRGEPKWK